MMEQKDNIELQFAYQTMEEYCQQLQVRLTTIEEENILLKQYKKLNSMSISKLSIDSENIIKKQQEKIEELNNQRSQLMKDIFIVSLENQKLWKRLVELSRINKSLLHNQPIIEKPTALTCKFEDISGLFKNINENCNLSYNEEKDHNLEEISLHFIKNIVIENTKIEKQYPEIVEVQTKAEITLKNIEYIEYPEDFSTDSFEQLKYHDIKLTELKQELLIQQNKLRSVLYNLRKLKKSETCNICKNNIEELMCQTETQMNSCSNLKQHETTQTSLSITNFIPEKKIEIFEEENICPLCGETYKKSVSFKVFHEHVINHFNLEVSNNLNISTSK